MAGEGAQGANFSPVFSLFFPIFFIALLEPMKIPSSMGYHLSEALDDKKEVYSA